MTAAKKTAARKPVDAPAPEVVVETEVPDADVELGAAEAEAKGDEVTVEHGGKTYILPSPLDYPVDVVFVDNDFEAVRLVLGEVQWQEYRLSKPTIRDFQEFNAKINEASGN
ncbi:hypothetical protein ABZ916_25725 [Streptomyces sp. NPDC046853]|uniref:hypothetical protein n=1 Tax=Streptomyces sp. NPDC046853 TaxID=3154920 RepID=UPI0033EDA456